MLAEGVRDFQGHQSSWKLREKNPGKKGLMEGKAPKPEYITPLKSLPNFSKGHVWGDTRDQQWKSTDLK